MPVKVVSPGGVNTPRKAQTEKPAVSPNHLATARSYSIEITPPKRSPGLISSMFRFVVSPRETR